MDGWTGGPVIRRPAAPLIPSFPPSFLPTLETVRMVRTIRNRSPVRASPFHRRCSSSLHADARCMMMGHSRRQPATHRQVTDRAAGLSLHQAVAAAAACANDCLPRQQPASQWSSWWPPNSLLALVPAAYRLPAHLLIAAVLPARASSTAAAACHRGPALRLLLARPPAHAPPPTSRGGRGVGRRLGAAAGGGRAGGAGRALGAGPLQHLQPPGSTYRHLPPPLPLALTTHLPP